VRLPLQQAFLGFGRLLPSFAAFLVEQFAGFEQLILGLEPGLAQKTLGFLASGIPDLAGQFRFRPRAEPAGHPANAQAGGQPDQRRQNGVHVWFL